MCRECQNVKAERPGSLYLVVSDRFFCIGFNRFQSRSSVFILNFFCQKFHEHCDHFFQKFHEHYDQTQIQRTWNQEILARNVLILITVNGIFLLQSFLLSRQYDLIIFSVSDEIFLKHINCMEKGWYSMLFRFRINGWSVGIFKEGS